MLPLKHPYIIKHGVIKMHCDFRDLEPRYGKLPFKIFTVTALYTDLVDILAF